ncbi:ankyrin repeat-containing domain protein [Russula earlei]|uniref:Ankyrin repeat-containing domain protein n=1 Tax=Russula earlei TaxID=71964 RepID=A0ACC0U1I7_9AGAM|nr:ankyrin repeat-containing domain protein [Russula earlei]
MKASQNGHSDVVRLLLENGAIVDSRNNDSWTPLMFASDEGHLDIIRLLLQSGANVEFQTKSGTTPLMKASRHGHSDVVRLLLQNGAIAHSCDNEGWTPVMLASREGHSPVVRLLVQSGADVGFQNNRGATALIWASLNGHLDVVRFLLQSGAAVDLCPDKRTYYQYMPLHYASARGHFMVAESLIQYGAEINTLGPNRETPLHLAISPPDVFPISGPDVDSKARGDSTSSHAAAKGGDLNIFELLLKSGADVNIRDIDDKTALDLALVNGRPDVAKFIHEYGGVDSEAPIDPTPLDELSQVPPPNSSQLSHGLWKSTDVVNETKTSLHTALDDGNLESVRSLLDAGTDVNERNTSLQTPLIRATWEGNLEIAKLLIDYGADVNSHDEIGVTPLRAAMTEGHSEVVRLLLDHGADVNAKDYHWTILHVASIYGRLEFIQELLDRGANVHARNDHGRTAFEEAVRNGERAIAGILSKYSPRKA